jgi:hypothetical protein
MVHAKVSKTEESLQEQIRNQDNGQHFFDSHAVHKELVPPGATVNEAYYLKVWTIWERG